MSRPKPGTIINDFCAHEDMIPTLLAAAGDTTVKEDLLKGRKIGDMTYKVHLDGYNLMPFLKGDAKEWPRHEFIYWTGSGSVAALRYDNWKLSIGRNARGQEQPADKERAQHVTSVEEKKKIEDEVQKTAEKSGF